MSTAGQYLPRDVAERHDDLARLALVVASGRRGRAVVPLVVDDDVVLALALLEEPVGGPMLNERQGRATAIGLLACRAARQGATDLGYAPEGHAYWASVGPLGATDELVILYGSSPYSAPLRSIRRTELEALGEDSDR